MADLLTFERFCQFQRSTVAGDSETETRIGNYIKAVCAWARWKVGCDLSTATRTARLSGRGGNLLYPPFWPITSVVSLGVSYGLGSVAWTVLQGTDPDSFQWVVLRPDGHCLMARYRPWPEGYGNILLTAVSGYAPGDPEVEDLIHALCMATALCVNEEQMIGEGSKSGVGPETVQQVVRNSKDYQVIMDAIYHHRQHY